MSNTPITETSLAIDSTSYQVGNYGYTAINPADLTNSEYTLVTICVDTSSSVENFKNNIEKFLELVVAACRKCATSENLLFRVVTFDTHVGNEIHGFRSLSQIKDTDYDNRIMTGGSTALFDALSEAINTSVNYAGQLTATGCAVNCVIYLPTDGQNNSSSKNPVMVRDELVKARRSEQVDSINVVLIGLIDPNSKNLDANGLDPYLSDVKTELGIDQYIFVGKATPQNLAKLAGFVSQSVSSMSSVIGSNAPIAVAAPTF